jgi:hypothetical protein
MMSLTIYIYTYMGNELLHVWIPIQFEGLDRSLTLHTLMDGPAESVVVCHVTFSSGCSIHGPV